MAFNSGTGITDHIDMLDKLIEVVTARFLESVAVNAGGTGYVVGDILGIDGTGATSTAAAQLEVTAVSSGVVTGLRVYRSGAYTVDPSTTTGNTTSGGTGSGCTADLTMSAPVWTKNRRTQIAASATVSAGGTGYTINDQITISGGVRGDVNGSTGAAAVFNVDSVSAGVVTAVSLVTAGNYEEVPSNPASVTGGTGSGCTLTVTWADPTFANTTHQVCMLEGEGLAGTNTIHVGLKTYSIATGFDTAYNWQLLGFTGYDSSLPIHQQPGIYTSWLDGDGSLKASDTNASVFVLKNNDADPDISWWINHNGRRIILVCKVEGPANTQYSSLYMGFLNQFATDTEYPYPLAIITGTNDQDRLWTETTLLTGGIVESIYNTGTDPFGPGFVRVPAGNWLGFAAEISASSSSRSVETEFGVYPFIAPSALTGSDQKVDTASNVGFTVGTNQIIPATGVPGTPGVQLKPTPGTGDDYYWLVPPIVGRWENTGANLYPDYYNLFGEIDGVFWFSTGNNGVVSEDRFELGSKRYTVFQNGNRTQVWSYFALDED